MAFLFLVRSWLGVQTESKGQTPARVCASNVCSPRSRSVSSFLPPPSRLPVAFQLFSLLAVKLIFALYWAFDQRSFMLHDPIVSVSTPNVDRKKNRLAVKMNYGCDQNKKISSKKKPSGFYLVSRSNRFSHPENFWRDWSRRNRIEIEKSLVEVGRSKDAETVANPWKISTKAI